MNTPILETERLRFFPFTADDLPLMADLHADPQVQRFLGGAWTPEHTQAMLDFLIRDHAEVGHSKWKAFLHDGTFVGRAGVQPYPREGEGRGRLNELGYAFKARFWGQGLATEAARALAAWFFDHTPHDHLLAMTEPDHHASQRVLLKIGMRPTGLQDMGLAQPMAMFRMERPGPARP